MHVLLTNDDGFDSPLLHDLCRALAARGHQVTVCAPDAHQSAKAHALTVHAPLRARPAAMEGAHAAWRVDGTPADCARLGLKVLCQSPVDLTVSGVNAGWNLGLLTYVSGTVAAAREAAFLGCPALALSAEVSAPMECTRFLTEWAVRLAERIPDAPLPPRTLVNVNFPACPVSHIQPPRLCPPSQVYDQAGYQRLQSCKGDFFVCENLLLPLENAAAGTDDDLVRAGHITVSLLGPAPADQRAWEELLLTL